MALALLGALAACRSDKPEDQVRRAFETSRVALEAGDAVAAMATLDPDFQGPDGMDQPTARLFLLGTLRQEKVGVTVLRSEVAVRGNEAFQEVQVVLTSRGEGFLPREVSQQSFRLHWRKLRGQWRLAGLQSLSG